MKKLILAAFLGCMAVQGVAQVQVNKNVIPGEAFEIPSKTPAMDGATYRWMVNGMLIDGAADASYSGSLTTAGTYMFIRQAKQSGVCDEWMSSNPYVVAVSCGATLTTGNAVQIVCYGSAMDDIHYTTAGVANSTQVIVTNTLPAGVIAVWLNGTLTVSGVPVVSGVFPYTVAVCGADVAAGTITVHEPFSAGSITTASYSSCNNVAGTATAVSSAPSGGNSSYSYQWTVSRDGGSASTISGATLATWRNGQNCA
jgi:hypothetical protein